MINIDENKIKNVAVAVRSHEDWIDICEYAIENNLRWVNDSSYKDCVKAWDSYESRSCWMYSKYSVKRFICEIDKKQEIPIVELKDVLMTSIKDEGDVKMNIESLYEDTKYNRNKVAKILKNHIKGDENCLHGDANRRLIIVDDKLKLVIDGDVFSWGSVKWETRIEIFKQIYNDTPILHSVNIEAGQDGVIIEDKVNKKENKMKNIIGIDISKMKNIMGTGYGILDTDKFKMALTGGIAVKSDGGTYKAFDKNSNTIVNTRGLVIDTNDMFLASPVSKIKVGDLLLVGEDAVYVTGIDDNKNATVINPQNGRIEIVAAISDIAGFKTYTRVFSLLSLAGVSDFGSILNAIKNEDDVLGKIKPLLMTVGGLYAMGGKDALRLSSTENIKDNILPSIMVIAMGYAMTTFEDGLVSKKIPNFNVESIKIFASENKLLIGGVAILAGYVLKDKVDASFKEKLNELENIFGDKKILIGSGLILVLLALLGKKFNIKSIEDIRKMVMQMVEKTTDIDTDEIVL